MNFDEKEIEDLAQALYEDAVGLGSSVNSRKATTKKKAGGGRSNGKISFEDNHAVDEDDSEDEDTDDEEDGGGRGSHKRGITVDDLKAELEKHDGLLENLSIR